ncbi:2'-5' RNA ligase family protein [Cellulomonas wangleii]|uniref:2'-5' RNA ligase family protein n=1 Tax=Cellulomonas wangleii TaxID=2816956 RepID=UPI0027DC8A66|nr:2'-5' RNA ligase family protein [Cellulomonas wangleii]
MLGPFVDRSDVGEHLVAATRDVLEPVRTLDLELSVISHFMGGLTYLACEPTEPFSQLTEMFAAALPAVAAARRGVRGRRPSPVDR